MPLSLIGRRGSAAAACLCFYFSSSDTETKQLSSLAFNFVVYALKGGSNESVVRIERVPRSLSD